MLHLRIKRVIFDFLRNSLNRTIHPGKSTQLLTQFWKFCQSLRLKTPFPHCHQLCFSYTFERHCICDEPPSPHRDIFRLINCIDYMKGCFAIMNFILSYFSHTNQRRHENNRSSRCFGIRDCGKVDLCYR